MSLRLKHLYLPAGLCLFLTVCLLQNPSLAVKGFQSGVALCVNTVLPALFPFFVICEWLVSLPFRGKALRLFARLLGLRRETEGVAVLFSWIGGYAVCAHLAGMLRKNKTIGERESILLLLLGCCSSPGFVIGCVGSLLLGNLRTGVLLYGMQIAANLLSTALCLPLLPPTSQEKRNFTVFRQSPVNLAQAISAGVSSSLHVCGCVVFFRVVSTVVQPFLPDSIWSEPVVCAFLEISSGCAEFAAMGGCPALYGCCMCMSVLGLSVWTQISMLLQGAIPWRVLAVNRILHTGCFLALVYLTSRILPGTADVFKTLESNVITSQRLPWDAAVVAFLFVCAALYKVRQNFYNK